MPQGSSKWGMMRKPALPRLSCICTGVLQAQTGDFQRRGKSGHWSLKRRRNSTALVAASAAIVLVRLAVELWVALSLVADGAVSKMPTSTALGSLRTVDCTSGCRQPPCRIIACVRPIERGATVLQLLGQVGWSLRGED